MGGSWIVGTVKRKWSESERQYGKIRRWAMTEDICHAVCARSRLGDKCLFPRCPGGGCDSFQQTEIASPITLPEWQAIVE